MFAGIENSTRGQGVTLNSNPTATLLEHIEAGPDTHALRIDHWMQRVGLNGTEFTDAISPANGPHYDAHPLNFTTNLRHIGDAFVQVGNDVGQAAQQVGNIISQGTDVVLDLAGFAFTIELFKKALGLSGLIEEQQPSFAKAA